MKVTSGLLLIFSIAPVKARQVVKIFAATFITTSIHLTVDYVAI